MFVAFIGVAADAYVTLPRLRILYAIHAPTRKSGERSGFPLTGTVGHSRGLA